MLGKSSFVTSVEEGYVVCLMISYPLIKIK